MNRLFGGGKNKGPSATNLQAQKSKQIESLRKVGAIEIIRDVEYRVVVSQTNTNLTIIINLPAQFPSEKPVLTVQPAVGHPWVDAQMKVVGCPNVNNFSMHSDLGQAVQAVLEEFRKNPPAVVPQHYILGFNNPTIGSTMVSSPPVTSLPSYAGHFPQTAPSSTGHFPQPTPNAAGRHPTIPPPLPPRRITGAAGELGPEQTSPMAFNAPNFSAEFPTLKDMKLSELHDLMEDEERILEMVLKIPDLGKFAQQRENLSSSCVQLAQSNLSKKPEIENLKESIISKNAEYDQVRAEFESVCLRHNGLSEQFHPSHIQTNLKVAVMEADEESEKLAEKFLDKEIDADNFLKAFMERRTVCHLRRAKEEKLNQIIMSQGLHF
ncbi:vacuolar protein sorting-associated protein 37A [Aplysia californica]|uniref:Vacuolar protein sorting-associated protein 37A n=1 Tax=Aplysia californica TaxID=6500 RepID=A0ABM0JRT6_APLCA|nr:vacuolar protein sorting-associated protein 37A [Aplysia californica]